MSFQTEIPTPIDIIMANGGVGSGYVLETTSFDWAGLDAAVSRVVQKWRLLAARVVFEGSVSWSFYLSRTLGSHLTIHSVDKAYVLRIPVGDLGNSFKTHTFTTRRFDHPLPISLPVSSDSLKLYPIYLTDYFIVAGGNMSMSDYSISQAPLLSLHITYFDNVTCVGIEGPHGVFDGIGFGLVLEAIEAELAGRSWEIPRLDTSKCFADATKDLPSAALGEEGDGGRLPDTMIPATVVSAKKERPPPPPLIVFKNIFIGDNIVAKWKEESKEMLSKEGDGSFVSTGDLLAAWLTKAAFNKPPPNTDTIIMKTIFDIRPTLSTPSLDLTRYPHNMMSAFDISVSLSTLSSLPLATLAKAHRQAIIKYRNRAYVKSFLDFLTSDGFPPASPERSTWILFSNQTSAKLVIDLKEKLVGFEKFVLPVGPVAPVNSSINKVGKGWVLCAALPKERWGSVEGVLREMGAEIESPSLRPALYVTMKRRRTDDSVDLAAVRVAAPKAATSLRQAAERRIKPKSQASLHVIAWRCRIPNCSL
ncbi:hypothetical protein P7C70_g1992, partial [Phenoliferia sp. Uapishka_3]